MHLTTEQQNAINISLTGESAIINACAGSGKSTTLIEIIKAVNFEYPKKRILACMFNKPAQNDFYDKLRNCNCKAEVRTTHSLAYRAVVNPSLKSKLLKRKVTRKLIFKELKISPYCVTDQITAKTLKGYGCDDNGCFNNYFISNAIYNIVQDFIKHPDLKIGQQCIDRTISHGIQNERNFYQVFSRYLLDLSRKLWLAMINQNNSFPITHDVYLKLWQLSRPVLDYDLILVDEAQDTNPVMQDIFELYTTTHRQQRSQIIYVGDEKQSIYAFRGAINAMERAEASNLVRQSLNLTQSFRFGQSIAYLANQILSLSARRPPEIRGFKKFNTTIRKIDNIPYTVLCRTNAGAISECISAVENYQQPHIIGDVKELVRLIKSAYALYRDDVYNIEHPAIKQFSSWTEYIETADLSEDPEMIRIIKMIKDKGDRITDIVKKLEKAEKISEEEAHIIISTVHKAKGREWAHVKLCEDFHSLLQNDKFTGDEEELNLLYVAITRGQETLQLNNTVEEILAWLKKKEDHINPAIKCLNIAGYNMF